MVSILYTNGKNLQKVFKYIKVRKCLKASVFDIGRVRKGIFRLKSDGNSEKRKDVLN